MYCKNPLCLCRYVCTSGNWHSSPHLGGCTMMATGEGICRIARPGTTIELLTCSGTCSRCHSGNSKVTVLFDGKVWKLT